MKCLHFRFAALKHNFKWLRRIFTFINGTWDFLGGFSWELHLQAVRGQEVVHCVQSQIVQAGRTLLGLDWKGRNDFIFRNGFSGTSVDRWISVGTDGKKNRKLLMKIWCFLDSRLEWLLLAHFLFFHFGELDIDCGRSLIVRAIFTTANHLISEHTLYDELWKVELRLLRCQFFFLAHSSMSLPLLSQVKLCWQTWPKWCLQWSWCCWREQHGSML